MAFADLGVKIVLEDGAKAGFDALGMSMFNMFTRSGLLSSVWSKLTPQTKALGIAAGVSGLLFGGLADFVWKTVDAAAQLEQEMANLDVSVNGASDASQAMSDTLVTLADHSIYTTAIIADGFTTLGVDGWNAKNLIDGMGESMVTFAEAARTDVVPAANLLGTTMETYGAAASDATQYTNDLTFALYNGQKTVVNMQAAFNQVGSTAHNLKVPFGELADALALLGEDGLKGTMAGSALRYMLTSLADPTTKALNELANLGIVVIHSDTPAFHSFKDALLAAGGAAAKSAENYDGTLGSMKKMFDEAKAFGLIHTDKTFLEWATATHILSDKLFDAKGNFIGIRGTIEQLGAAIDKMNPEQKQQAIQQLFNVRGAQAAKLLLDNYRLTLDKFGNLDLIRKHTDAMHKADEVTGTFAGTMKRLGSTWQDTLARLGSADLGPLKDLGGKLADLLDKFNTAPKSTQGFVTQLLLIATGAAGLVFVITIVGFVIGAFSAALEAIAGPALIVVGVIAGIVATFAAFRQALQSNKQVAEIFHTVMGVLGGLLHNLGEQFQNLMKTMKLLEPVWNVLKVVLMVVAGVIVGIILVSVGILIGIFIALTFVINLVIQVLSRVFSAIGNFLGMLGAGFSKIPTIFHNAWNTAQHIIETAWNNIKKSVSEVLTIIKKDITGGFDAIHQKISDVINGIVGWFRYLYNHYYVIQALVDLIHHKFDELRLKIEAFKALVLAIWTALWNNAHQAVVNAWNAITGRFTQAKSDTTNRFNEIKNSVLGVWTVLWHLVQSKVSEGWNNIVSQFNQAKARVMGPFNAIKDFIQNILKDIATNMFNSGKHMIQMLIDGIQNMIAALKQKITDVGNTINKILMFHSPPAEGPLSDSDKSMPNMMKMFAAGIESHTPLVGAAASKAAAHINKSIGNINPKAAVSGVTGDVLTRAMVASNQSGQQNGINQTLTIPLTIDGQVVSTVVLKQIGHELTMNGVGRTLR